MLDSQKKKRWKTDFHMLLDVSKKLRIAFGSFLPVASKPSTILCVTAGRRRRRERERNCHCTMTGHGPFALIPISRLFSCPFSPNQKPVNIYRSKYLQICKNAFQYCMTCHLPWAVSEINK